MSMGLLEIPGRAFLDTSSLNFILENGESIFDGVQPSGKLSKRALEDIDAFYNLWFTGSRAFWQLAVSPLTYQEISATQEPSKRYYLENWFNEVWSYWLETIDKNNDLPSLMESEKARIHILSSGILNDLHDVNDRILICDAIVYKCDCFCTRDWKTILRKRNLLKTLPIKIVTPTEWWSMIKPYASLWV